MPTGLGSRPPFSSALCRPVAYRQAPLFEPVVLPRRIDDFGNEQVGRQDHIGFLYDASQPGGLTALDDDLDGRAGVEDRSHRRRSSRMSLAGSLGLCPRTGGMDLMDASNARRRAFASTLTSSPRASTYNLLGQATPLLFGPFTQ